MEISLKQNSKIVNNDDEQESDYSDENSGRDAAATPRRQSPRPERVKRKVGRPAASTIPATPGEHGVSRASGAVASGGSGP